ncbi:MAG TPA: calcium/proton exchanger [Bryobacteraceae bacterium]|nr:calcium/proton exchanger [Bryobacteraceae bacterium]
MRRIPKPSLNWLLVFVPLAIVLHYLSDDDRTVTFAAACLAIIPLAGWLGKATDQVARKTTDSIGGLLNATFGNMAELIIGLTALRAGLASIVKASLAGSIIGNLLLVLGGSVLAGGIRFKSQQFNPRGARVLSTMLTLAAIAFIAPAAYHRLAGGQARIREDQLGLAIAIVLLITYGLGLLFSLHTHKQFFTRPVPDEALPVEDGPEWGIWRACATLAAAAAMVAWISEILVSSVEHAALSLGMTELFIGAIVLAVIGNAAEHSTAILFALKNRMDLSLSIAVGSSIQVALFVTPVLLLASHFIAPAPMDLVFSPAEIMALGLSILIVWQISADGESNWLEGVQLIAVYVILALVFYLLPGSTTLPTRR